MKGRPSRKRKGVLHSSPELPGKKLDIEELAFLAKGVVFWGVEGKRKRKRGKGKKK